MPIMICHDQEILDFLSYDNFNDQVCDDHIFNRFPVLRSSSDPDKLAKLRLFFSKLNLNMCLEPQQLWATEKPKLLLHSEKKSKNLELYNQKKFIGVYWWSHAIIARDWFRYAEHDPNLQQKQIKQNFLIYNRAWSGVREYRLKFAELIVKQDLQNQCMMKFNPWDSGQHYQTHVYRNLNFTVDTKLEDYFMLNEHDATASADYVTTDYVNTGIEVVLETLFDDDRWHLTEKILRPIACGQPFMLAATPGALSYLRSYGFQTFSPLINESYDSITDPVARLQAIIAEMRRIADLDLEQRQILFDQLRKIAAHNRGWFFCSEFHHRITSELQQNFAQALTHLQGT